MKHIHMATYFTTYASLKRYYKLSVYARGSKIPKTRWHNACCIQMTSLPLLG